MCAAVALSLGIAGATLALITQHSFFLREINSFRFIRDEAPQINRIVTSLFSSANNYWIYSDKSAALAFDGTPVNTGAALVLSYRNPSGIDDELALIFETNDDGDQLNLYTWRNGWQTNPDWTVTSVAENITFSDAGGVLTIAMTGRLGEEITYMGSSR